MAALLNSLSFAFANSFLPKYCVKYYDYNIIVLAGYSASGGREGGREGGRGLSEVTNQTANIT